MDVGDVGGLPADETLSPLRAVRVVRVVRRPVRAPAAPTNGTSLRFRSCSCAADAAVDQDFRPVALISQ